jgi:primosomal protein N' (replication factor Y)
MAAVEGTAAAVADVLAELGVGRSADLPPHHGDDEPAGGGRGLAGLQVLGPVELEPAPTSEPGQPPVDGRERALLRVPRADGRSLAAALHAAQAARTARKVPDPVRIRLDPIEIG